MTELPPDIFTIVLDRPERHNALVPDLLHRLRARIGAATLVAPRALIVTGAGRSFSTGGDIAGFLDHADSTRKLKAYAREVVGAFNAAILDLLAFPAPVIARVNGPVTGGSVGFLLAADLVAMSTAAFIQPYYGTVGFCPDGGWTALLPERIGTARALEIQYLNRRIGPDEALALGLATATAGPKQLDRLIEGWCNTLTGMKAGSLAASRGRVWDESRRQEVSARLAAELEKFVELAARPETVQGMRDFMSALNKRPGRQKKAGRRGELSR